MSSSHVLTAQNSAGYATPVGIAVDPVVFTVVDGRLNVLLIERLEEPQVGMLSLPGGFQGDAEDADETVGRKLHEKTGLNHVYLEKLTFHSEMGRDPRGWMPSLSYVALVEAAQLPKSRPAGDARWVAVDELPDLAFDHATIVAEGVERLAQRSDDLQWFIRRATPVLGDEFTLGDTWKLYGQLSRKVTASTDGYANFRRDLMKTGLIVATEQVSSTGPGRPAKLYRRNQ